MSQFITTPVMLAKASIQTWWLLTTLAISLTTSVDSVVRYLTVAPVGMTDVKVLGSIR